ncbi:DUF2470 domain-containing protein [Nonomuraea sp. NPDC046570]|uniref:DUF2470 domain-containing protein n=1 Tax=Nonomuraea sp. NPDC046570 TaxID=3155255 RepID=UPI0033F11D68
MPLLAPPLPERIRTLAGASAVTHACVAGSPMPARRAHGGVDASGRPLLLVRPGEELYGLRGDAVVTVDLNAVRMIGAVEHPRSLLKVQGWAEAVPPETAREAAIAIAAHSPDDALFEALERYGEAGAPQLLRVDVGQVVYLTGQESGVLDAEEYLEAAPDPLAEVAERVLAHVNGAHRPQLGAGVSQLLDAPAEDAWLWELDRFGATVRLGVEDPSLARFPWPEPVESGVSLESSLRALLCAC